MRWAIYDLAPSYFVRGTPTVATLGEGIADQLLGLLIRSMPDYQHELVLMNMPRVMAEMQAGKPICVVNAVRSPERAQLAYSTPLLITPAPQLVLSTRLLERHPEWKGGVSLAALTRDPELHGQFQVGRSFGDKLDAILRAESNVGMKPNSGASAANALRMISMGRADYTIEYPILVALRIREKEVSPDVVTLPILDADPFLEGVVLCTRTAWGLDAMRRIDRELQQHAATPEYQQALARWLSKQELSQHQLDYERFYQRRARTRYCTAASCP